MAKKTDSSIVIDLPEEAVRIEKKVEPREVYDRYIQDHIVQSGRVADFGCGPGNITREIAVRNPSLEVVGFDIDEVKLKHARSAHHGVKNLRFHNTNITQIKPGFDFVFSRLLFEYLSHPETVIKKIYSQLNTNGTLLVQDIDGNIVWYFPDHDELNQDLAVLEPYFRGLFFDPYVGRKLYTFFHRANFSDITIKIEPYHIVCGSIDPVNLQNWEKKFAHFKPLIIEALGTTKRADHFIGRYLDMLKDPASLMYSNLVTVVGQKTA